MPHGGDERCVEVHHRLNDSRVIEMLRSSSPAPDKGDDREFLSVDVLQLGAKLVRLGEVDTVFHEVDGRLGRIDAGIEVRHGDGRGGEDQCHLRTLVGEQQVLQQGIHILETRRRLALSQFYAFLLLLVYDLVLHHLYAGHVQHQLDLSLGRDVP